METLNVSSLWKLPMIFMCEHNTYSEFSPSDTVTSGELADRAKAFMPTTVVDGNDVTAVWAAAKEAVARARNGDGPSYIEAKTYRIHGHIEAEVHFLSSTYREKEEIEKWQKLDPIDRLRAELVSSGAADEATLTQIESRIQETVAAAEKYVEAGEPASETLVFDLMSVAQ